MTFVVIVWVSSLVVVLSALLCPGRLVATRSLPPFLVGFGLFLSPSGSVLVVAGAILGWHGQESGAKFFISVLNFTQPPQFTFTFSIHHLLPSSCTTALSTVCHPGISSPLQPPLYGGGHFVFVYSPPSPSPLLIISWGTGGHLSGWVEASPGAASHGDLSLSSQS